MLWYHIRSAGESFTLPFSSSELSLSSSLSLQFPAPSINLSSIVAGTISGSSRSFSSFNLQMKIYEFANIKSFLRCIISFFFRTQVFYCRQRVHVCYFITLSNCFHLSLRSKFSASASTIRFFSTHCLGYCLLAGTPLANSTSFGQTRPQIWNRSCPAREKRENNQGGKIPIPFPCILEKE